MDHGWYIQQFTTSHPRLVLIGHRLVLPSDSCRTRIVNWKMTRTKKKTPKSNHADFSKFECNILVYFPTIGWSLEQMLIHIPYMEHVGFLQVTGHIGYLWAGPEPMISRNIGKIMGKYRKKIWQILYIYKWRFKAWKWIKLNGRFSYATLHGRRLEKDRKGRSSRA